MVSVAERRPTGRFIDRAVPAGLDREAALQLEL